MAGGDDKPRRIDVGLEGGGAFSLRLTEDAFNELQSALQSDHSPRWHKVVSEESDVLIDLSKVVYVRVDTEQRGVGFSGP
jgi:hypothetical protein